ncbi:penicillin acylase family protein [Litorimonas haliclonae]|uniref:penicillin acylase family protein n=1 Tax=Litorimonas haliclonae TaxID=2081977 RepID=UPI0039F00235
MKTVLKILAVLILVVLITGGVYLWTPSGAEYNEDEIKAVASEYDARIIRDNFGVAHVFGQTDADASFGFGYAHAEDDWTTIQDVVIAARGMSAQYKGKSVAPQDYLYDLFKVHEAVSEKYDTEVRDDVKAVAKGYADALNLYAVEHPEAVLPAVLPITEQDVLAGFTWATPFFYRLDGYLEELFTAEDKPNVSPWQQTAELDLPDAVRGSNAFAVAPSRSADGHTRLILNSHQPMTGPYAWYEAHMVSKEGMNIAGATFPGVPIIAQGVNPNLGWAQTVNRPDLIDIYALEVDDFDNPAQYKLDDEWQDFEKTESEFRVNLFGPFSLPVKRDVLWSEHGPVLSTPTGHYAIRFSGLQGVGALQQWFDMGKATNMTEWRDAVAQNNVLSFNIVYGDKDGNIGEVYNAKMPNRIEGPDWEDILPGDQSELIWTDFRPLSDMPQIWNPECGWVFSANATPFNVTDPACNNNREDFSETFGIEDRITNRSRRALELLTNDESISREELLRYRADTRYDPQSDLMRLVVDLVSRSYDEPILEDAKEVLRNWDGDTDRSSRGAALAVITGTRALGYEYKENEMDPVEAFRQSAEDLRLAFGRLDPEWGEVNRLQRGETDLPLDGAPDVLRAIYANRDGVADSGSMNAFAGDTHIMVADWDEAGELDLVSIHQYGAATLDADNPHYADQAPLFSEGEYKAMPMTLESVLPLAERDYRPGQTE